MSRTIQRLICLVGLLVAIGAQQLVSAAPTIMCYYENCFDAGLGIRPLGLTQDVLPLQASSFLNDENFSINTEQLTPATQTFTADVSASGRRFSLTANSRSSTTNLSGLPSGTVDGAVTLPEPASMLLLGAGLGGLVMKARKKHQ